MAETESSPSVSPPALPTIVALVTTLGSVYALGEPYPDLPPEAATPVPAVIEAIEAAPGDDLVFLVRGGGGLPSGFAWRDRVWGSGVVALAYRKSEEAADAEDLADDDDPAAGIDVRRVVLRVGGTAAVFEVNRTVPEIPGIPGWLRGKVTRIYRSPEGVYRARISVEPGEIFPPGSVLVLGLHEPLSALEVLSLEEAEAEELAARTARIEELEAMIDSAAEDDDDDGEEDDSQGEEPAEGGAS